MGKKRFCLKDMSQVHPANTQPAHNGWYLSCMDYNDEELAMLFVARLGLDHIDSFGEFSWYWRDGMWYAGDFSHTPCANQTRRWMGVLK